MTKEAKVPFFSHEALNSTIHEKSRLGILTILATQQKPMSFSELLKQGNFSNGNLSRHIRNLEDEGLIEVKKSFADRRPRTDVALTKHGRDQYFEYIDHLESLILQAKHTRAVKKQAT